MSNLTNTVAAIAMTGLIGITGSVASSLSEDIDRIELLHRDDMALLRSNMTHEYRSLSKQVNASLIQTMTLITEREDKLEADMKELARLVASR